MAGCETSFNSYTFAFEWTVSDLERQLLNNTNKFSSPQFSSPSGAKPATTWMLTIINGDSAQTPSAPVDEQSLSVELKRLDSSGSSFTFSAGELVSRPVRVRTQRPEPPPVIVRGYNDVWVEARLKSQSSNFDNLTEFEATSVSEGPTKLCLLIKQKQSGLADSNAITFKQCLPLFKVQDSESITFKCEIKVCPKEPALKTNFSLSKFMEEARQQNLFTDVTLVADGKEFKAHKVVLATQSQFFKTRFSGHWESSSPTTVDTSVEMTDVPVVAMEAILSYVYTGKVIDIGKIAYQLLPIAEEYGVLGLRKMCEENLIQSLTSTTVINMLIHAASHNAPDLKQACIEFIVYNTAAVRESEGWGKLKKDQTRHDLWVEVLEDIAENH